MNSRRTKGSRPPLVTGMKTMRPQHTPTNVTAEEAWVIDRVPQATELSTPPQPTTVVAKLLPVLRMFPGLADPSTMVTRLFLCLVGFLPVTLIAASTFGVFGLRDLASHLMVPAVVVTVFVAGRHRNAGSLVLRAMLVGAIATGMYDLVRFSFIWTGLMHVDPIPHIGVALHLHPSWVVGYLWRYCLNGAGLSVAFFSLGLKRVRQGLAFGFFVAMGLITVIIISPHASQELWALSVTSVSMIILGHLTFGAGLACVSGLLSRRSVTVNN